MELNSKQRKLLRKEGVKLDSQFQIGKNGVTKNVIDGIGIFITKHELIKIKILPSCTIAKEEIAAMISVQNRIEIVQIIGKQLIFYKPLKNGRITREVKF